MLSGFLDRRPGRLKPPSKKPVERPVAAYDAQKKSPQKRKRLLSLHRGVASAVGTFGARQFGAFPPHL